MGCQFKQGGGLYTRLRVGAVLLAAGEGQRMGGVAKSLIRLQGVPLINRQLVALSGAGVDEVVVVTGHARDAVEAAVAGWNGVEGIAPEVAQKLVSNGFVNPEAMEGVEAADLIAAGFSEEESAVILKKVSEAKGGKA